MGIDYNLYCEVCDKYDDIENDSVSFLNGHYSHGEIIILEADDLRMEQQKKSLEKNRESYYKLIDRQHAEHNKMISTCEQKIHNLNIDLINIKKGIKEFCNDINDKLKSIEKLNN